MRICLTGILSVSLRQLCFLRQREMFGHGKYWGGRLSQRASGTNLFVPAWPHCSCWFVPDIILVRKSHRNSLISHQRRLIFCNSLCFIPGERMHRSRFLSGLTKDWCSISIVLSGNTVIWTWRSGWLLRAWFELQMIISGKSYKEICQRNILWSLWQIFSLSDFPGICWNHQTVNIWNLFCDCSLLFDYSLRGGDVFLWLRLPSRSQCFVGSQSR